MSALGDYLAATGRRPWAWGTDDCCTFTADWCVALGYPDPLAFLRGQYADEAGALEHVRRHGLVRLAARGYRSIGLERTADPLPGDVAVLRRPTAGTDTTMAVCAIRLENERWATRLERGISVDEGGVLLAAWRVEWARR